MAYSANDKPFNPHAWKSSRPKSWPPGREECPVEIPELNWQYVKPEHESMQEGEEGENSQ